MSGIVYLLTNPVMPGLTKIGKTNINGLESRLQNLYNTSIPIPFHCFYACEVEEPDLVEKNFMMLLGIIGLIKKESSLKLMQIE